MHQKQDLPIIEIAILVTEESTLSTVYGMVDLLSSVGRDWSFILEGVPGKPLIKPTIVSTMTNELCVVNNARITPERVLDDSYQPDAVCILELFINPNAALGRPYRDISAWLLNYWNKGGVIAAACSGALLLAESGLLDGLEATTHWGYCDIMAQRYPQISVQANRTFIATGDQQRLLLAGAGASWMDLGLYLIAKFVSVEEAIKIAKIYLIEWHDSGQQAYAFLCHARQNDDAIIADSQVWLSQHYDVASPVNSAMARSGLTERTFKRRFKQATGMTPISYVLNLRVEEAKTLLEGKESHGIESIAEQVGYQDTSFFTKTFQKKVGMTPAQYRKKFSRLREILS